MGCPRAAWTTALAIALALLAAGTASAFQFRGCVSANGAGPCANADNANALNQPSAVVVSPDGRHVYSAARAGDTVTAWNRDPSSGALSFQSCVRNPAGSGPCSAIGLTRPLDGPSALAISPDGKHVYVTASPGDTVAAFVRNPNTGDLTLGSCMSTNAGSGCVAIHNAALNDPSAIAISPDGDEVFVAGSAQDIIGYFARNPENGSLAFFSCVWPGGTPCSTVSNAGALDNLSALAVSPDGRFLYAAAHDGDTISVFSPNNALNNLVFNGCIAATNAGGCTPIPAPSAMDAPSSLGVSTDGKFLFVTARNGHALTAYARDQATGALFYSSCDSANGAGPCADIANGNALNAPSALAVGPAGSRVYATAAGGNAVTSFARGGDSDPLGVLGCIGATGSGPCASSGNANALSAPAAIAASPDGRHLYVAAGGGAALGIIGVAPPACSPVSALTPFQTAVRVQFNCGDPDGDHVSFSAGAPANGTLSELNGNTVLFTPNPGFFGQGVFDFSASDVDGAASARATIDVGGPPAVPPPARVRRLDPPVRNRWAFNRTHTWIMRLVVQRVPGDATVQVRCKAPKRFGKKACPFKRKSAKPKRAGASVNVRKMFRKRTKLRAGIAIQIRITAPGAIGKVVTYKLRPKKLPRSTGRCLPPGATKPQKSC